jgi:hypothetical protein
VKRLALCCLVIAAALPAAAAPLARDGALPVRILFDNSGSMYPGYLPPGSPGRQTREQLGVHYVYQSPTFAQWLDDFVQRQSVIGGTTAGMWTFTSNDRFTPADVQQIQPDVPLRDFRAANAIAHFPPRTGNSTYLTESLNAFSRDFTGVVWLVTDNIVETNAGEPDIGVKQFFESLAHQDEYRSVHLFKYALEENGHTATFAVYGILVSAAPVPNPTLASYDQRFRELSNAKRLQSGGDLFAGREHLKLKNLSIEPMVLSADLQLVVEDREKGTFAEGDNVRLALDGEIKSYLTQHSVTAGRYELAIGDSFVPEEWAQHDIGAQAIPSEVFDSVGGSIDQPIPPNGSRRVEALLHSQQPVSFTPKGLAEWVRLAWNGATVRYTGAVRMSFTDIRVKFERQRMAGIFGIDHAEQIFEVQNVATISNVQPSLAPVSFELHTTPRRTAILLAILAVLAVLAGIAGFLLSRKQIFRIRVTGTPEWLFALRRLGSGNVMHEGKLLGRLSRGMFATYAFHPVAATADLTVVPATDGEWDVRLPGGTRRMTIKAEGGTQKVPPPKANAPTARAASPPPRSPSSKPPPPPGRPLRPGRP